MNTATKAGLGCGGLLVAMVLVFMGALLAYVIHSQHDYKNMTDTHDLAQRTSQLGTEYIDHRPNGGLVIGLLQRDKCYVIGFGRISATNTSKPDSLTIFEIGSITKVLTGITLAKLVDDGVVKLNDPISLYLPKGVMAPRQNGHEITLGQLATHTSGLPRVPANLDSSAINQPNPYANYQPADLYQSLTNVQLNHEPGRKSDYSNYGFGLLGHLLELKTGLPYETLVTQTLCQPLGMSNTVIHLAADQLARLSPGHNPQGAVVPNWDFDALAGCGAFRSDASDLLNFLAANLATNNAPVYRALTEARKMHFKQFSGGLGLAWQIAEPVDGRIVYWHNGGTGGYVSYVGLDHEHKTGVVLLSNYGDAWVGDMAVDRMGTEILKLASKISWQ